MRTNASRHEGRPVVAGGTGCSSLVGLLARHQSTGVVVTTAVREGDPEILEADRTFSEMLGYTVDELVGRPLNFAGEATDFEEVRRLRGAAAAGEAVAGHLMLYRSDGGRVWVMADVAPVVDDSGEVRQWVILTRDVTEQHEAQRELQITASLLEHATAAGAVGIWEWEPERNLTRWNRALRDIVGIGPDEPVGPEQWLRATHPEDRVEARRALDQPGGSEVRCRIVGPDGDVRHVIVRGEQIAPAGEPERYAGLVINVTESQQAAAQVLDTLESITDAYFSLDRDWRFGYVNRQAERLLDRSRADLLGSSVWEQFPAAVGTSFERYRETMEHGHVVEFEEYYEPLEMWCEVRAYPTSAGIAVYFRDVTERHLVEEERARLLEAEHAAREAAELAQRRVEHQATHDPLTGLLNRVELVRRLDPATAAGTPVTVLFLDIDRFKLVNDSLGHWVGDQLVRAVADRLAPLAECGHIVARLGGDELVVGLIDCDHAAADAVAERLLQDIRQPLTVEGRLLYVTASIGLAASRGHSRAGDLLLDADVALYRAKDAGRDQAVWFDERARGELLRRIDLEHRLRDAIDDDALGMHYQPSFDLRTGALTDVEALARWADPEHGDVAPAAFIEIAEESGLIHRIGEWAVGSAARQATNWHRRGGDPARFWANVSPRQLVRPDVADMLARHLEQTRLDPASFGIEVTESALADNSSIVRGLRRVAESGIQIAIDDFGTGYSSISRLSELPVDIVKIDRSFVHRIESPGGVETIAAIVDLAHALEATVIAEGVEARGQLEALRTTGCDRVCGYLLARPAPPECLADAVAEGRRALGAPVGIH